MSGIQRTALVLTIIGAINLLEWPVSFMDWLGLPVALILVFSLNQVLKFPGSLKPNRPVENLTMDNVYDL